MIAIIPARGGSKRFPGKNIRELDGIPIINRVIDIAYESGLFSEIIVSTDSMKIHDTVKDFTHVAFRPPSISGDIPEDEVLKYLLQYLSEQEFCRIYPFAALLTPKRLKAGFLAFREPDNNCVLECQKYGHPPQRRFTLKGGYIRPQIVSLPTEVLEDVYHDAGTFMFSTYEALQQPLEKRNIKWLPVKEMDAQDIDTADDWESLEAKWRYTNIQPIMTRRNYDKI